MLKLALVAVVASAALYAPADAQPRRRPPPPPPPAVTAPAFEPTGWTLLGEQTVNGRRDRDTIRVGRYQGRFDQLTIVVKDSDLSLTDFTVVFGNGERWSPRLKHAFREGARSRAIDLPGGDRVIAKIELAYANLRGGGRASVAVYGRDRRGGGRPPGPGPGPRPTGFKFDATGWTLLGTQTVNGRRDRDVIRVGRYQGSFDQLTLVVTDSDLELRDLTVVFGNNTRWSPRLKHVFREGQRSHAIDLPGKDRKISRIELAYANLPGGGKARVEIYGRDLRRPPPPPPAPVRWDNKGWTFLGKATVDGWRERDRVAVGNPQPFTEVMFVVGGSDVELHDVVVTLGNGEKFSPPTRLTFREGSRTRPIDIPGKLRKIRSVDFAFANLPGGGRAHVEVWARRTPQRTEPPPPPPPPAPAPTVRDQRRPPPPPPPAPAPAPTVRDHRR